MKFNPLKTRSGTLKRKIDLELKTNSPRIENILKYVDEYEASNLATIEKLKRKREVISKRINGALRQTISAHGPITKILIGSATKRIMGAMLENPTKSFFQKLLDKIRFK